MLKQCNVAAADRKSEYTAQSGGQHGTTKVIARVYVFYNLLTACYLIIVFNLPKYLLHMPRILSQVLVMIEDHKLHCAAQLRRVNINTALIIWWMEDTCITVLQCTYMINIICNTDSGTCLPTWYFMSSCFLEVCSGFCSDSDSDDFVSSISASELLAELEPADGAELILNFEFWENHKTTQSYV